MPTKGEQFDERTAPDHVWVCAEAVTAKGIGVVHRAFAGLPGYEQFAPCGFRSADFDEAYRHADEHAGAHYVYEHPRGGDVNMMPRRSMHGSDGGGAYIDTVDSKTWRTDAFLRENVRQL